MNNIYNRFPFLLRSMCTFYSYNVHSMFQKLLNELWLAYSLNIKCHHIIVVRPSLGRPRSDLLRLAKIFCASLIITFSNRLNLKLAFELLDM